MKNVIIAVAALLLFACGEDDTLSTDQNGLGGSSEVNIISSENLQIDRLFSDEFRIVSATPYQEHFEIIVEYGGGCADHQFELYWDHIVAESFPMQTWMTLSHLVNDDNCKALVTDTLMIEYQSIDGFNNQDMIVHLANVSSNQAITIDSRVIPLTTEDCELEVTLERALCGRGPWGDLWFKLPTGIGAWEQVWLQPVRVPEELELMNPAEGSTAKIKVRGLFGYEYPFPDGEVVCLALPAGLIMPVEVLCME